MSESKPFRFGSTFAERAAAAAGESAPVEQDEKRVRSDDAEDKAVQSSEAKQRKTSKRKG